MPIGTSLPTTGALDASLGLATDGILFSGMPGVLIVSIDHGVLGDDGGWLVTATGIFPTTQGIKFQVQDIATGMDLLCYGGVIGGGEFSVSEDGTTIQFVIPPLPIGGPYDIYAETEDGVYSDLLSGALTIIERSWTTNLYSVRANFPPPRDVGNHRIEDE